jgi:hypothetical protein
VKMGGGCLTARELMGRRVSLWRRGLASPASALFADLPNHRGTARNKVIRTIALPGLTGPYSNRIDDLDPGIVGDVNPIVIGADRHRVRMVGDRYRGDHLIRLRVYNGNRAVALVGDVGVLSEGLGRPDEAGEGHNHSRKQRRNANLNGNLLRELGSVPPAA